MFEKFRKEHAEHEESSGSEMVEERPQEEPKFQSTEKEVSEPQVQSSSSDSQIGIRALKDKRVKLEEAIDYVGLMIKNLKDKRTKLEKEIEDVNI